MKFPKEPTQTTNEDQTEVERISKNFTQCANTIQKLDRNLKEIGNKKLPLRVKWDLLASLKSRLVEQLKKQEAHEECLKTSILAFEKQMNYRASLRQHLNFQSRNDISSDLTQSVIIRMDTHTQRHSIGGQNNQFELARAVILSKDVRNSYVSSIEEKKETLHDINQKIIDRNEELAKKEQYIEQLKAKIAGLAEKSNVKESKGSKTAKLFEKASNFTFSLLESTINRKSLKKMVKKDVNLPFGWQI